MKEQSQILDLRQIKILALRPEHDLSRFCCGETSLDKYICKRAAKHHASYKDRIFCATHKDSNTVFGLYSMSIKSHDKDALTDTEKTLVVGPYFSAVYIGTVAVLRHYQGRGLGKLMLVDALKRAYTISQNAALLAVALRSIDQRSTDLYQKYGFGKRDDGQTPLMILPILSLVDLFENRPSGQLPR